MSARGSNTAEPKPRPATSAFARSYVPLALLSCALALALRLPRLGAESLWYDETVSAYLASQPVADALVHTALDIHPPGYYLLLHFWTRLAGSTEFSLAFLSLWFGVLLVALTFYLARKVFGSAAALVAALLAATSAYGVWYSQEVRMYTVGACLCLGFVVVTLAHRERPRLATALAWAALVAASLYVLYYALFLALPLSLALLVAALRATDRRRHLRLWLLAQAAAVVAYLPWLGTAVRQALDPPVPPWRSHVALLTMLRDGALALFGGEALAASLWPLAALAVTLAALGAWSARKRGGLVVLASCIVPWLALVVASAVTPLFHPRYLFPFAPGFWACLGAAIALPAARFAAAGRPPARLTARRWAPAVTAVALLAYAGANATAVRAAWIEPRFRADDLRTAVQALVAEWCPGDVILADAGYTYTALAYYWPGTAPAHKRLTDYRGDEPTTPLVLTSGSTGGSASLGWGDRRADFYPTTTAAATAALRRVLDGGHRLWVLRLYDTVTDPAGDLRQWLSSQAVAVDDRAVPGPSYARLQAYVPRSTDLPCETPTDWDGQVSVCASVGGSWSGAVPVYLATQFAVAGPPPHYTLRLLGAGGAVVAQRDGVLGGALFADAGPETGQVLAQPVALRPDAGLAPGRYQVQLGLYTVTDGLRALVPSPTDDDALAAQGLLSIGYVEVR